MNNIDKLMLRIKSLEDGFSTITLYYKEGELMCWAVTTSKAEGEKGDTIKHDEQA